MSEDKLGKSRAGRIEPTDRDRHQVLVNLMTRIMSISNELVDCNYPRIPGILEKDLKSCIAIARMADKDVCQDLTESDIQVIIKYVIAIRRQDDSEPAKEIPAWLMNYMQVQKKLKTLA